MKTPANNQEQMPRAEAPGAHTAWVGRKELWSRRIPAGAGANKKARREKTRRAKKRSLQALREVKASFKPSHALAWQASPGRRFSVEGLGWAPAPAGWLLDRTPVDGNGRAGIEGVEVMRPPFDTRSRAARTIRCPGAVLRTARQWPFRWLGNTRREASPPGSCCSASPIREAVGHHGQSWWPVRSAHRLF